MKTTSDLRKATLPGEKSLFRLVDPQQKPILDVIACKGEQLRPGEDLYDPFDPTHSQPLPNGQLHELHRQVMAEAEIIGKSPTLAEIRNDCAAQLENIPQPVRDIHKHVPYPILISSGLHRLREQLLNRLRA
jgi:hypothetical protein